jgi:thiamine biosynthesis protein ThiI
MMLRITDEIRRKNSGLAIITGESLGQVASQTLESMIAINDVTSTPILRPLVAMDKLEIIDIAKKIDTYEISNLPYEDCCTIFTPPSPKTKPKLEKIQHFESFLDFTPFIEEAVAETESFYIHPEEDPAVTEEFEGLL